MAEKQQIGNRDSMGFGSQRDEDSIDATGEMVVERIEFGKVGGFAFPQAKGVGNLLLVEGGLTVRDYFAAKAMQAIIPTPVDTEYPDTPTSDILHAAAKLAYEVADAMLWARGQ